MPKSKKIFILFAFGFALMLAYLSYDIGKRTTFPGSKPLLPEKLKNTLHSSDTADLDSVLNRPK